MIAVFGTSNASVAAFLEELGVSADALAKSLYAVYRVELQQPTGAKKQLVLAVSCEALHSTPVARTLPLGDAAVLAVDAEPAADSTRVATELELVKSLLKPSAPVAIFGAVPAPADAPPEAAMHVPKEEGAAAAVAACLGAVKKARVTSLKGVQFEETLKINAMSSTVTVLGRNKKGKRVIATVALCPLTENAARCVVERPETALLATQRVQKNGKFAQYHGTLVAGTDALDAALPVPVALAVDVIAPATAADVIKNRPQPHYAVQETEEMYETVVRPAIEKLPESELEWVRNVIDPAEGAKTTEEVLFETPDGVLMRDTKWATGNDDATQMYCLLVVKKQHSHLRSVRDLRGSDADWLEASVNACQQHILERYGVQSDKYLTFFHYHPAFYHLHIHFVHLLASTFIPNTPAGRVLRFSDVLQNLRTDSDYYKHATITTVCRRGAPAMAALIAAGYVPTATADDKAAADAAAETAAAKEPTTKMEDAKEEDTEQAAGN